MRVDSNSIYGYYPQSLLSTLNQDGQDQTQAAARTSSTSSSSSGSATTFLSSSSQSFDIWRALATQYDLNSMDAGDLDDLSQSLYDAGQISLGDRTALSFDPEKGTLSSNAGSLLTGTNASGKVDWQSEFKARLADAMDSGDMVSAQVDQQVLGVLGRLQAAKQKGVNCVV
ncbi:hypothetical protein dsx2_2270 [Desulfovibrio sp. X2]|uniref:hypothetical protein n=1 Tax=Desulfovibrio sp. X2 TaxID=941449 RepID=UPI000358E0D9|nr:hypothetical protein [Desulfovibrio sp. X2]EPR43653.1 hypothetical protein dsx2_2270 [Desulfovibrio sp. X2]